MKRASLLGMVVCGLGIWGCNPPVDYGNTCRLTRPAFPDGGGIEFIKSGDDAVKNSAFDFLSNGDPDCEDLVCIRQAGKDYSAQETDGNAHGECSTDCLSDDDCGDPAKGLKCTQLAFDQTFLQNLCSTDPATCREFFGDSPNALYCTDPNLPDLASP
ncbi:MAG: adventurous gliding motility lipoprotein CglC [Deltaproteobacteria bacterium]|nr:adventurous gliding motility lipoprotein CglC [Deltaproteobacteria bacterium]